MLVWLINYKRFITLVYVGGSPLPDLRASLATFSLSRCGGRRRALLSCLFGRQPQKP